MAVWSKYFTEQAFFSSLDKQEIEKIPHIEKAIGLLNYSHYSINQLLAHGEDPDSVLSWNNSIRSAWENGKENGKREGIALTFDIIKTFKDKILTPKELAEKLNVNLESLGNFIEQQSNQGIGS